MKLEGQLIARYKDGQERDRLLDKLQKMGFKCGHPLCKFETMTEEDKNRYFNNLPFVVDFKETEFSATNVTCLAAASSSEKGRELFVDAGWLTDELDRKHSMR
jgi:hypothetical protein